MNRNGRALAGPSMANMAPAGIPFSPPLFLAKPLDYIFLKLATKVYFLGCLIPEVG